MFSVARQVYLPLMVQPAEETLSATSLPVKLTTTPFTAPSCQGGFILHRLDHVTEVHGQAVRMFETNGSGVAINDLNRDGLLDLVFANLNGPATIFWNQGKLAFEKESLPDLNTRAVNLVDVNGDGRIDIVFTHIVSSLTYWENTGPGPEGRATFERIPIPGVRELAHSMTWGDLNGDGTLDLVTGSYDAELNLTLGNSFLFSDGAGIYAYTQRDGAFSPTRLSETSQALVIALIDVNRDHLPDILVGNDFNIRDIAWVQQNGTWQPATPFSTTSEHTMNFDWGDINNDGIFELFATDMAPYDTSPTGMAPWMPMMEMMMPMSGDITGEMSGEMEEDMSTMMDSEMMGDMSGHHVSDDPQIPLNVLQMQNADGTYQDVAEARGVAASGWAWSGKFGDLNQDGLLDLYVVNGMIDVEMFHYLPGNELVEANQVYQNLGGGFFEPTPDWNIGSNESGRGMSMADLDNDGDLDIVINNLASQAQLFENQLCSGASLTVDLRWPESQNAFAIGAQLILHSSAGDFIRDVRASSGYLSGDATRVHFGFPTDANLTSLEILWPDGMTSTVEPISSHLLTITR